MFFIKIVPFLMWQTALPDYVQKAIKKALRLHILAISGTNKQYPWYHPDYRITQRSLIKTQTSL